jgi:NADPH-dependent 2,4-dienoyl-CoA reductase/sulfur reductase-like enzyme/rhodanese-related sulfurtransferase
LNNETEKLSMGGSIMKTIIVGGVAGGASAAARLRRLDEQSEIILLERGEHISFANCGLPYYIGEKITEESALTLQTPKSFNARFNIDVRNFSEAIDIDRAAKTVTVRNALTGELYSESYDKLILSTGAEPVKPPINGIDSDKIFTLRNIPDTLRIKEYIDMKHPKAAIVVGGGYIGVEMAENLSEAGLEVTLVELTDHVIAPLDFDMASEVHNYIRSMGIRLILNNGVKEIIDTKEGLSVVLQNGSIEGDMLIMAVGVRPESGLAKRAGLALNSRGAIIVNSNMLTSDQNIYAVGDVAEIEDFVTGKKAFVPLAGPANKQGRIAADNICGLDSKYTGTQGSSILKLFDMAVAMTGINESTAKANNIDYDKVFLYTGSHASYYPGSTNMWVKVLFEKETGKILGAQITGFDGVDKRIDVLATAIRLGASAKDLTELELCYAPPFGSAKDPVNMAGYVIENIITGKVKNFHWHDIDALPRDNSVTLLDVRTRGEVRNGMIDGFINIPLDELRSNIGQLDKTKPIYVHCRSGLRSYIACRILAGNGFDAYNLSGGYQLYETVMKEKAH